MFDPFDDFAVAGYLRNHEGEKDLDLIKVAEHQLFRAQLPVALDYLERREKVDYPAFLEVHRILFEGLYPWAGQDRQTLVPDKHVTKGAVHFSRPSECRRAVEHGLHLAQDRGMIRTSPGVIMGLFAYGHPFLDGNGRTMLVVHSELCHRAGVSIDWTRTRKNDYLIALTAEIEAPDCGHLDAYLAPFAGPRLDRQVWQKSILDLRGLDGARAGADQVAAYEDPGIENAYDAFQQARNYCIPP
jgi:cell filamentation protein